MTFTIWMEITRGRLVGRIDYIVAKARKREASSITQAS
jgi:hypothetical protein